MSKLSSDLRLWALDAQLLDADCALFGCDHDLKEAAFMLDAQEVEITRLSDARRACRKAVSSTANEPRRNVRDIADAALEIYDRERGND